MAPTQNTLQKNSVDRVRHELLTALHFGKLTPGDRAPSVRGLARRTGMNKKTVHRAYTHLAREGLVYSRPGSGTFITERSVTRGEPSVTDLLSMANRCKAAAGSLGLPPEILGEFLGAYLGQGLRGLRLAVTECNHEQLGLIASELQTAFGIVPRPLLISELMSNPNGALERSEGIVTTDCHLAEVSDRAKRLGLPAYRVALDPSFPQRLADEARRSRVVVIVRDQRFEAVFLRLLKRLPLAPDRLERIRIVDVSGARGVLQHPTDERTTVVISPLVEREISALLPTDWRVLRIRWRIETASMQRLRAGLALDLARRRHAGALLGAPSAPSRQGKNGRGIATSS